MPDYDATPFPNIGNNPFYSETPVGNVGNVLPMMGSTKGFDSPLAHKDIMDMIADDTSEFIGGDELMDYRKDTVADMMYEFFGIYTEDVGQKTSTDKTPNGIAHVVKILESKGYQVKYSSPGYSHTRFDNDRNKDGVINSKLQTTARIIFSRDYSFKRTPQGWSWKVLEDGKKALYVKPYTYNEKMGSKETAFKKWQVFYISNIEDWANELPKAGTNAKMPPDEEFSAS